MNINFATIVAVYVLILIGGMVRAMGAGMGCPDWPKCFGQYFPPTSQAELPENYEQLYLQQRQKKNKRIATLFHHLGFHSLAQKITSDPRVNQTEKFNVTLAWIEYLNRIVGVIIGLLVVCNAYFSIQFWKKEKKIVIIALLVVMITIMQGWMGSLVVSTNLLPGFITVHMLIALLIVLLLIYLRLAAQNKNKVLGKRMLKYAIGIFLILLLPQIISGTLTREQVDILGSDGISKSEIVSQLTGFFDLHRHYAVILFFCSIWVFFELKKNGHFVYSNILIALVLLEIILGVILYYGALPFFIQPFHLLLATVVFGFTSYLFLGVKRAEHD